MQTFELHIEELTKSMNEKFSELESRANNVLPALSQSEIPSQFSNFSFDQTFDLNDGIFQLLL